MKMIKSKIFFFLVMIMLICSILVACNDKPKVKETFTGTIEEIYEFGDKTSMLVNIDKTTGEREEGSVTFGIPDDTNETFRVGDKVKVGYDGTVMEIAPPAIHAITLEKIEQH